jgi:hypothetical protein
LNALQRITSIVEKLYRCTRTSGNPQLTLFPGTLDTRDETAIAKGAMSVNALRRARPQRRNEAIRAATILPLVMMGSP